MAKSDLRRQIRSAIAALDAALIKQLSEIVHHQDFTKIFSTWAALHYLVKFQATEGIKVKILDIRWKEVQQLMDSSGGIDNPLSFKIFNEQEAFGAEPLSLLITDKVLDVSNKQTVDTLDQIAQTAAYAFLPFVAGISARLFDCQDFSNLDYLSLDDIHRTGTFFHLNSLAKQSYSAFIGLILPEVEYPPVLSSRENFLDMEVKLPKTKASGAFAFAAMVTKSFAESGWFLDMLGMPIKDDGEIVPLGAIPNLGNGMRFTNGALEKLSHFANVPFAISEDREKALSKIGLIALCQERQANSLVLHHTNTIRSLYIQSLKDKPTDELYQLQYLLCVCRFAHYIRAIGRAKVGQFVDIYEMENHLNQWLTGYIASNPNVERELKRRYPLLGGKVVLANHKFFQTSYNCSIYLRPHLLSCGVSAGISLRTDLSVN